MREAKLYSKRFINALISNLLHYKTGILVARKILRCFPGLEQSIQVYIYYLKKENLSHNIKQENIKSSQYHVNSKNSTEKRKLLIDLTQLFLFGGSFGIRKVVSNITNELLNNPPQGWDVEAVYADGEGRLRHIIMANNALCCEAMPNPSNALATISQGDVFYCPYIHKDYLFPMVEDLKNKGVRVIFTVYDTIPLLNKKFVHRLHHIVYSDWFSKVLELADGIVCDSRAVVDEIFTWVQDHPAARASTLPMGYFHLGVDTFDNRKNFYDVGIDTDLVGAIKERPSLLMVGTLERHKGHDQVLAAIDLLWNEGTDVNLIIVGSEGWNVRKLVRNLRSHREQKRRLFWLDNANDQLIGMLYSQSSALLAASYVEGFGLPIIEAGRYGLPIICREIPVFQEVAGEHAYYFKGERPRDIAQAIYKWLELSRIGEAPVSNDMPRLTWSQSAEQLLQVILHAQWCCEWKDVVQVQNPDDYPK